MTSKKIRFVTDTTSDVPQDIIAKHDIRIVPAFVNYGGESYADDGIQLDRDKYYEELDSINPAPKTAAPPPALAEEVIKAAFEGADHLVIVTVPQTLSGLYNAMRLGSADLPPDSVTLIDSGTTTMGLGWQVIIGAETADATGDVAETIDAMRRVRDNQKVYAALATMKNLQRSGRVGWAAANIGALLQIKPLIKVGEGEIAAISRVRTFKRAVDELIHLAQQEAPLDRLAIIHCHNRAGAEELKTSLGEIVPQDTIIVNVTTALGTHVGPGALGVATVSQKWKQR